MKDEFYMEYLFFHLVCDWFERKDKETLNDLNKLLKVWDSREYVGILKEIRESP